MEVLPGAVAQPVQQNVWGPLVGGVSSAAGTLASVSPAQWKSLFG